MDGLQRLFIGVPVPEGLKPHIRSAQGMLPRTAGLRLLPEEQWHVTLAFLGEVGSDCAASARNIVDAAPSSLGGESTLGGFLLLPSPKRARVVTLAVEDDVGVWADLYGVIMRGLEERGVMEREARPFRPHLTIARVKPAGAVRPKSDSERVRFPVESVCLYRSELRRVGPRYTVVARRLLAGRRNQAEA